MNRFEENTIKRVYENAGCVGVCGLQFELWEFQIWNIIISDLKIIIFVFLS